MLISLHITHSSAGGMTCLGDIIPNLDDALRERLKENRSVEEYVIIRTCNRLEAYISTPNNSAVKTFLDGLVRSTIPFADRQVWYFLEDRECIKHLFTVVCGIDSLIVGEDQIQHQIRDAFSEAQKNGHVGRILYALFNNALIVGKRVRTETELNKGAVSVGYAAIELAEERIGSLKDMNIAIIGAGDMAGVIAKNLAGKGPRTVIVSNRTFERAKELAKELEGTAIGFDRLEEIISKSDLVLVATSAKHNILGNDIISRAMSTRPDRPLLIIDVSVPTNVDPDVEKTPGVSLRTMASLDAIAAENVARRTKEISKAEKIIREELVRMEKEHKSNAADAIIRKMSLDFEEIRTAEVVKAMKYCDHTLSDELIDNLTHAITSKISSEIIKNLRKAALDEDTDVLEAARFIFGVNEERSEADVPTEQTQKAQTEQ